MASPESASGSKEARDIEDTLSPQECESMLNSLPFLRFLSRLCLAAPVPSSSTFLREVSWGGWLLSFCRPEWASVQQSWLWVLLSLPSLASKIVVAFMSTSRAGFVFNVFCAIVQLS